MEACILVPLNTIVITVKEPLRIEITWLKFIITGSFLVFNCLRTHGSFSITQHALNTLLAIFNLFLINNGSALK